MPVRGGWGLVRSLLWAYLLLGAVVTPAQAQQHAGDTLAAQQAVERSDQAVKALEHEAAPTRGAVSEAWAQRSDLVLAWRQQADAWAAAEPGSAEAKAAVAQSIKAMEAFYVPSGGLAPDAPGTGNDP